MTSYNRIATSPGLAVGAREYPVELFGHLERFAASIYPYRWFIAVVLPLLLTLAGIVSYRRGWHRFALQHRIVTAAVVVPLLVVSIPVGYYLVSPLWTRTHLEEASPLGVASQSMPPASTPASAPSPQPSSTSSAVEEAASPTPTLAVTAMVPAASTATPLPPLPTAPLSEATATPEPEPVIEPQPEPTPQPVIEPTPEPEPEPEPTEFVPYVVLAGEFQGADDFHFGSGSALLIAAAVDQHVLRLENFSVQNGPDLFVYLSTSPNGWSEDGLNLGELRATDGSFNYDVPAGIDISQYQSVVIWCRAFAVLFSSAPLM